MSRSVDERIVEMQFNNKQFEEGIRTSMSTIEKFNKSLNFDGTAKSFSLLERAASNVNLAGLGNAVGTVSERFSALETIAVGALFRIGEKAVDAGERLVKSLSIDQVTAGWSKYADKTQSVQTIMAATRKDFEDTGEQMEYVNEQLDKLNWFTDETSYNFLEMVNNIGKFTNNNIKLDNAVTDMQGISTWAALAGANSNEASRAMYNLSQAVSVGAVKLMDWKSIENANMATAEFKETAMETAKELGILSDEYEILQMTADKYSGDKFVDIANFSQTLSSGWFTADVLEKTLAKYGAFTDKLYEATDAFANQYDTVSDLMSALDEYEAGTLDLQEVIQNTGMTAEEVTAIFDELTSSEMDLGRRGFKAAQEAKTFQEAIDATKDAVSTGWMTTFELIFGDYEKAKKLWTGLANELYDIFAEPGNKRNDILSNWLDMGTGNLHEAAGGRKALNEGVLNYYNNLKTVLAEVKEAFHDIFPERSEEQQVQILRKMTRSFYELSERLKPTEETLEKIRSTAKGFFAVVDIGKQAFSALASELLPSSSAISTLAGRLLDASASFGDWLVSVDEYIKENNTFVKAIQKVKDVLANFGETLTNVKNTVSEFLGEHIKLPEKSPLETFAERIEIRFTPLSDLFNVAGKALQVFGKIFGAVSPLIAAGGKLIADGVGKMLDAVSEAMDTGDFSTFFDIINGVIAADMGIGVNKFITALTKKVGGASIKDVGILGVFDELKKSVLDTFSAIQNKLKPDLLMSIAKAIGLMTLSFVAISLIDSDKLLASMSVISGMMLELVGAMKILEASKFTNIKGVETQILLLSTSMLIMALALKSVGSMNSDEIEHAIVALTGALALITGFCKVLKLTDTTRAKEIAGSMVTLSLAMVVMGAALKIMGSMSWEELGKSMIALTGTMILFTGFLAIMNKLTDKSFVNMKGISNAAKSIVVMSAAMVIMGAALKIMGSMELEEIGKAVTALGSALVIIAGFCKVLKLTDTTRAKDIAGSMIALAASMVIMGAALKIMGSMSWGELGKSMLALTGTMVLFTGFLAIMNKLTDKSYVNMQGISNAAKAILIMSAAMVVMGAALKIMGSMSLPEIGKSLLILASAFVILGGAAFLLNKLGLIPVMYQLAGAVALLGVGLAAAGIGVLAFATGLTVLAGAGVAAVTSIVSMLGILIVGVLNVIADSYDAIVGAVKTIVLATIDVFVECVPAFVEGILLLLENTFTALRDHAPQIVTSFMEFLIGVLNAAADKTPELIQAGVNLMMKFFGGVIDAMNSVDTDTLVEGIKMVGMISKLIAVLAAVGVLVPAAMISMVGVAGVIAELALVLAAIGELEKIPGLQTLIDGGGNLLQSIGTAIGKFIGGIAGGFAEGVTSRFPKIGQDLSDFMTNAQGFIDGASSINASMLEGVGALTAAVVMLTGAEIIAGLASWFGGKNSLAKFGEELSEFGPYLANFSASVKDVKSEQVKGAAEALLALAKAADAIPNEGGWLAKVTGENSLSKFGEELGLFGPNLVNFSDSVEGVNAEQVKGAAEATLALAKMAKEIPNEGGLVSMITGDNSLAKFGEELASYGNNLKPFVDNVKDIEAEQVSGVVAATNALIAMAKEIPNSGGLISKITGDNNLADFAEYLKTFGEKFVIYADNVKTVPANIAIISGNISKSVKAFTEDLPDTSGLAQKLFGGEVSLRMLAEEMSGFAPDFVAYAKTVTDLTGTNVVTNTYNLTSALNTLNNDFPDSLAENDLDNLGEKLKAFAKSFVNFASIINLADTKNLSTTITELSKLAKISKDISDINGQGLVDLSEGVQSISTEAVANFIQVFTKGCNEVRQKTIELMDAVITGMNSRKSQTNSTARAICTSIINAFKNNLPSSTFRTIGTNIVQSLANGISAQGSMASSAARNVASSVMSSFTSNMSATSLYDVGANVTSGLINGMNSKTAQLQATSTRLGTMVTNATRNSLMVRSPSRVFYEIGEYVDQGLINGINDNADGVGKAGSGLGQSAIDAMKNALKKLADLTEGKLDAQPTIRPVVDLTDVERSYEDIGSLFSRGLSMSATYDKAQAATRNSRGVTNSDPNGSSEASSKKFDTVIDEVRQLRSNIGELAEEMTHYQVVMDTGALVGQMSKPLNSQMGEDAVRHSRR